MEAAFPTTGSEPLVTVIVGTRNRAELLARALRSIAAQSLVDFECLIVDDGSSAGTLSAYKGIVAEFGPRFRLVQDVPPDSPGTGPGTTRNRGLTHAAGRFVTYLDDDDWWIADDHLQVATDSMTRFGADYLFTNRQGVRAGVVLIEDWYERSPELTRGALLRDSPKVFDVSPRDFCTGMGFRTPHPGNLVVTRALAVGAGGVMQRMFWCEDYEFCVRLADRARRILYRPSVTTAARLPEGNSVSLSQPALLQQLEMITASEHLRVKCTRPEFRKCARAREAWTYRELAQGDTAASPLYRISAAWQALWLYPTPGAVWFLARCLGNWRHAPVAALPAAPAADGPARVSQ